MSNENNWKNVRNGFLNTCRLHRQAFLHTCTAPEATVAAAFSDCITRNRDTAFGKHYNFDKIHTLEEYRKAAPIHRYKDLEPWINRILDGKKQVLTVDEPYSMLKTSGTSGPSKAIPHTAFWRHHFRGPIIYALWGNFAEIFPWFLDHPYATLDFLWERERPNSFVGCLPYHGITNREISLGQSDFTPPWYDAAWVDFTNDTSGFMERIYLRIRYFVGHDLRMIAVIQPNRLILLAEILAEKTEHLIKEVHNGELRGKKIFSPDPGLAAKLEKLAQRDGVLLPKSVWPNLDLITCWKSRQLQLYTDQLPGIYPNTRILPLLTGATEAMVTCPVDDHPEAGVLTLTQGIYEFIPHSENRTGSENANQGTLFFDQLSVGKTYQVIITQANGLYRYDLGDLYRVVEYKGRVPRLDFVRRRGIYHSFNGEKLTETQVMDGFQEARDLLGIPSSLYACFPVWDNPPGYVYVVEVGSELSVSNLSRLPEAIDRCLAERNSEYEERIRTGRLARTSIKQVATGTFKDNWNEKVALGACAPQLKHYFCQKRDGLLKEIESAGKVINTFYS